MKNFILLMSVIAFAFSCKKTDAIRNPVTKPVPAKEIATKNPQTTTAAQELKLDGAELKISKSGAPWVFNNVDATEAKAKLKITKLFKFKSNKNQSLNFKDSWQQLGKSKCKATKDPEMLATIKVGEKETTTKYSEAKDLELPANQELQLTITLNNTESQCEKIDYTFAVLAKELEDTPPEPAKQ